MGVGARDHHLAGLDRLAQRLEHRPRELGELVQEEDAVVGEADLARASRPRPPPTMAAIDAVWCGSRNGRAREMPPSSGAPRASGSSRSRAPRPAESGGRMPGRRAASIDLPDPGGPTISRWWRPAAAISSARLALSWPLTSRRSRGGGRRATSPGWAGASRAPPVKWRTTSASEPGAITWTAPTQAASAPQARGQSSAFGLGGGRTAAGSAPITGTSAPSSDSSPRATVRATSSRGRTSMRGEQRERDGQVEMRALLGQVGGREVDGDPLGRQRDGHRGQRRAHPLAASETALSGRPTMVKAGMPAATAHCTSTSRASTPSNATV